MPDITMCEGTGCSWADRCYRATATPNPHRQSYFMNSPYTSAGCEYFSPNSDNEAVTCAASFNPHDREVMQEFGDTES